MTSQSSGLVCDFARNAPENFARSIESASVQEIEEIMEQLPESLATALLIHLPAKITESLVAELSAKRIDWFIKGSLENAKAVLIRIPQIRRRVIVNALPKGKRRLALQRFLAYPNHSLGRFVSSDVLIVNTESATTEVIRLLKASKSGTPVVIVDRQSHYVGLLDTRKVIEGDPDELVGKYVDRVKPLLAESSLEGAMELKQWQRYPLLAVIDHEKNVLGVMSRERLISSLENSPDRRRPLDSLLTLFGLYVDVLVKLLESLFKIRNRS